MWWRIATDYLENDFGRLFHRDIVPVESAINTVLLLLDCHWELLEGLVVEASLPKNASELSSKRPLVRFSSEERY